MYLENIICTVKVLKVDANKINNKFSSTNRHLGFELHPHKSHISSMRIDKKQTHK